MGTIKKKKPQTNSVFRMDKNRNVKQSNNLVMSRYSLTLLEQRIMYAICSQQPRNGQDFVSVRLPIAEWADAIGIESKNKYSTIRNISNQLMRRIVTIPCSDGGEYTSHWIQSRRYYPEDSSIEFWLDPKLRDEFLELRKAYVDAPLRLLVSFKSSYAARLYTIIAKSARLGEFDLELDFFRRIFELGKAYKRFDHLKDRVFEPALTEINEKSDISVKWDYVKEGRAYTKIHFSVSRKASAQPPVSLHPARREKLTEEGEGLLARLTNPDKWNITEDVARKMLAKHGAERVKANLLYADRHREGKTRLGGWLVSCIERDEAGKEQGRREAKAERDRQEKERQAAVFAAAGRADEQGAKMTEEQAKVGREALAELKRRLGAKED